MQLIDITIDKYSHMIPLWKSPIKLPVELRVELSERLAAKTSHQAVGPPTFATGPTIPTCRIHSEVRSLSPRVAPRVAPQG